MFFIYLKTSFRHLWQSRLYSLINILGLATGITAMLLAILFWKDEDSFDRFHKNNPHLYRITTTLAESKEAKVRTLGGTGQVQGPAFKAAIPELKSYTRVMGGDLYNDVVVNNRTLKVQALYVDSNFLEVFTFPVLKGDPKTALDGISSIVITESTAKKLFNSTDMVGKLLNLDANPSFEQLGKPLMITAVVTDPPKTSSLQFDALHPFAFMELAFRDNAWLNAYLGTFIVLDANADVQQVISKFNRIYALHAGEQLAANIKTYGYDPQISYGLQPITDIHFNPLMVPNSNAEAGVNNGSDPVYSIIFFVISAFILVMASINFINISIAGSLRRSKEVAVRKISGGSKQQIIMQFLIESAILCLMAFLFAVIIMQTLLPLFNTLTGKQMYFRDSLSVTVLFYFSLLLLIIIGLTAIYPAFILSNFKPAEVLYNKPLRSGSNFFGRGLVVVQFIPAIFLLIAALIYYEQMSFVRTKDLGYNPENIIRTAIYGDRDYKTTAEFLKNELAKETSIKMISFGNTGYKFQLQVNRRNIEAIHKTIDENYLPVMEIPLIAGKNISVSSEKDGAIVNETFVKDAGLEYPIGTRINLGEYYDHKVKIITGVVKDYHFGSLRDNIRPVVMFKFSMQEGEMWVKVEKTKVKDAVAKLETAYRKAMPSSIFQYNFLDELNAREYREELRWQKVISIATLMSFLICCLGLFGLAHLATYRRVKEIGIRKVLGATVTQIIMLLSGNFLKMVLIAFVFAAPVAWIAMSKWLQDFAYRIQPGPGMFITTGFMTVGIAVIAVIFQSLKAALDNPVKSLRTE